MSRAIDVTIMPACSLVLYVSGVDGDTAGFLLRSLVDGGVVGELGSSVGRKDLGDGSG